MSQPVIDFSSYISRSSANFTGRKWVFVVAEYEQEWTTNSSSEESQIDERLRNAARKAIQHIKRRYG